MVRLDPDCGLDGEVGVAFLRHVEAVGGRCASSGSTDQERHVQIRKCFMASSPASIPKTLRERERQHLLIYYVTFPFLSLGALSHAHLILYDLRFRS